MLVYGAKWRDSRASLASNKAWMANCDSLVDTVCQKCNLPILAKHRAAPDGEAVDTEPPEKVARSGTSVEGMPTIHNKAEIVPTKLEWARNCAYFRFIFIFMFFLSNLLI